MRLPIFKTQEQVGSVQNEKYQRLQNSHFESNTVYWIELFNVYKLIDFNSNWTIYSTMGHGTWDRVSMAVQAKRYSI